MTIHVPKPLDAGGLVATFERVLALTDKRGPTMPNMTTCCWVFRGCVTTGYGRIRHHGRMVRVHRVVYRVVFGRWADVAGREIDHTCRNRRCVRPIHLECVTHAENMRRMSGPREKV